RGVARRLLDEATRLAREAGCELRLQGPQDHLEAQALAPRLEGARQLGLAALAMGWALWAGGPAWIGWALAG
ncbi:hypothetical protein R0G64_31540, partial [Pseudomonas otitidis]|nr:hypothetical protein [Pseudomonas otitidis]